MQVREEQPERFGEALITCIVELMREKKSICAANRRLMSPRTPARSAGKGTYGDAQPGEYLHPVNSAFDRGKQHQNERKRACKAAW